MLIVAGYLQVPAADRAAYLDTVSTATRSARRAAGCLEFVQAADPLEPDRIIIYERWRTEADLLAFRSAEPEPDAPELPPILAAEVARYEIAAVGPA